MQAMYTQPAKPRRSGQREPETATPLGRALRTPQLPDGYHAQAAYEFRDPSGTFSYEFSRVYGPPRKHDKRGPICELDEDLSFWSITNYVDVAGDDHSVASAVSFARARSAHGGHLKFGQFASELYMRRELHDLLTK
jgi:hypothetical protein